MTVQICRGDTWKERALHVNYTNIMLKLFFFPPFGAKQVLSVIKIAAI